MAKSLTPRLKKLLTEAEYYFERLTKRRFVVDNAIKSRHTANAVLKQAGLPKAF